MSIQMISYYHSNTCIVIPKRMYFFQLTSLPLFSISGNNDKSNIDCKLLLIFVVNTAGAPHWMSLIALLGIYVHELYCMFSI